MRKQITFLGTGHASVIRYYNTCFLMESDHDKLLVDAGGGNGILTRLEKAGIVIGQIHHMFVTHTHMDHILGTVWILRMVAQAAIKGEYQGQLHVYGHDQVIHAIRFMTELLLNKKHKEIVDERVVYRELINGEQIEFADFRLTAVDAESAKCKQFGIILDFADGKRLFYPGDEPYRETERFPAEKINGVDMLIHEAFCLYGQRDRYDPYGKQHSTARDAAICAAGLNARTLVLVHTEEDTAEEKKQLYEAEAGTKYSGKIIVPGEMEKIILD